jgi:hypothetical protein
VYLNALPSKKNFVAVRYMGATRLLDDATLKINDVDFEPRLNRASYKNRLTGSAQMGPYVLDFPAAFIP